MLTPLSHHTVTTLLKIVLVLSLLLLPFATAATPSYALPTHPAPNNQTGDQGSDVVILKQVKNPDGTTDVTVRIYASPNAPNTPDATYPTSQSTYIASGTPTTPYGGSTALGIGFSNSGSPAPQAMRMLVQFNLGGIPSNAVINSATTYIYQYAVSPGGDSPMGFQAQLAVASWNQNTATWSNANFIGGTRLPIGNFPGTIGWLSFDSVNLIRTWVSGQAPNFGLIVTGDESPTNNRSRFFYSSRSSINRPYVDINYTVGNCDTIAPTSSINPLPAFVPNSFTVSWTGSDSAPAGCSPSGIASYIIWYQVNNGAFVQWIDSTSATSAVFNAAGFGISSGATVGFRSQATDRAGNKQPAGNATANTIVDSQAPFATVNPLPQYTDTPNFWVTWSGTDSGSGIATYSVQYRVVSGSSTGPWQNLLINTPQTQFYFTNAQTGNTYQFQAVATDNVGNVQPWGNSPQAQTRIFDKTAVVITPFTPSILEATSSPTKTFTVRWTGYTPPNSYITNYTILYSFNGGTPTIWQTFPGSQTSAVFDWTATHHGDGVYAFSGTAANNIGSPAYTDVPPQNIVVDMAGKYKVRIYLPLVFNDAPSQ